MKKIFAAILFAGAMSAFAQTAMPRFDISTARNNGMGGTHVAYTDSVGSLLVNPAAMMRVRQVRYPPLSFSMHNPHLIFGMMGPLREAAAGNVSKLGDTAGTLREEEGKVSFGFGLNDLPLGFAWVANGFGFGVWETFFLEPSIVGTNILVDAHADVILPVGLAFRILHTDSHDVDAGVTVKPFIRALFSDRLKIIDLTEDDADPSDSLSLPLIVGAGFDLGFMYRWDIGFSAGLTFSDIATWGGVAKDFMGNASGAYYVPFSMNWGVAYDFRPARFWPDAHRVLTESNVVFAFDWRDFTNVFQQKDYTVRNAALGIGLGLEFSIIKIFKIRLGMNECLPAFGIGFDIGPVEIDLAYYGRELGLEPGQLPVAVVTLSFAVRPEAKPRNWPWTRRSLVGLIKGKDESYLAKGSQQEPEEEQYPAAGDSAFQEPAAQDPAAEMD